MVMRIRLIQNIVIHTYSVPIKKYVYYIFYLLLSFFTYLDTFFMTVNMVRFIWQIFGSMMISNNQQNANVNDK